MVIIVTGTIGIGKTTVCRKLLRIVRKQGYTCGGILTYKAPDKSIIVEDIQTGEVETLASTKNVHCGPSTAKYSFTHKGINFGIQAIDKGASAAILIVDEIGHLELRGEGFINVIELARVGKVKNCIMVIRKELLSAFLSQLDATPLVFEATSGNRERLPREISTILAEKLVDGK